MQWRFKGIVVESVAAPAAGANWTYTQAAFRQGVAARRLVAVYGTMVTDANAANRELRIEIDDGTNILAAAAFGAAMTATSTKPYSFQRDQGVYQSASTATLVGVNPLGSCWILAAAWRVRGILHNIQAGDQFSINRLVFEEWG